MTPRGGATDDALRIAEEARRAVERALLEVGRLAQRVTELERERNDDLAILSELTRAVSALMEETRKDG